MTLDTAFPGANMAQVSPTVDGGPALNIDNGAGSIRRFNDTSDVVDVPAAEATYLIRDGVVTG
jgi:hypothetical protein